MCGGSVATAKASLDLMIWKSGARAQSVQDTEYLALSRQAPMIGKVFLRVAE